MEVHHHAHTPRKKWTHYFWEFLMLFLAVFCGFLAENQREHFIEHQREKTYMKNMLEDLRVDSIQLSFLFNFFDTTLKRKNINKTKLKPPVRDENIEVFYKEVFAINDFVGFHFNNRTIRQLESSGNFRLLRNKEVIDSIMVYNSRMEAALIRSYNVLWDHRLKLMDLGNKLVDKSYQSYFDYNILGFDSAGLAKSNLKPLYLISDDPQIQFSFYNSWIDYVEHSKDLFTWISNICTQNKDLAATIKKAYHLK